jgi:hypothetical protein
MAPKPEHRLEAYGCLEHPWLKEPRKFLLFGTHQRNCLHIHITQFPESRTKFSYGKTSEVRSDINDSLASGNWDFLDRTKPEKATDLPIRNTIYTALKSRTLPSVALVPITMKPSLGTPKFLLMKKRFFYQRRAMPQFHRLRDGRPDDLRALLTIQVQVSLP